MQFGFLKLSESSRAKHTEEVEIELKDYNNNKS
jgi:hypothetical protein